MSKTQSKYGERCNDKQKGKFIIFNSALEDSTMSRLISDSKVSVLGKKGTCTNVFFIFKGQRFMWKENSPYIYVSVGILEKRMPSSRWWISFLKDAWLIQQHNARPYSERLILQSLVWPVCSVMTAWWTIQEQRFLTAEKVRSCFQVEWTQIHLSKLEQLDFSVNKWICISPHYF